MTCHAVQSKGMRAARWWPLAAALLAAAPAICAAADGGSLEITPQASIVEGARDGDVLSWKGVPFAALPIGDLRWRTPQPAVKWQGERIARQFAPGRLWRVPRRG